MPRFLDVFIETKKGTSPLDLSRRISKYVRFHKNPSQTLENMDRKVVNISKEMYARRQGLPPGIDFVVKIGKFGVPWFHEFATDSYKTLPY